MTNQSADSLPQASIDADAFNAFEMAGWDRQGRRPLEWWGSGVDSSAP
jgi:hypothetical protein